jgi:NAD(P)H dehydrogenase (quinone)
MHHWGAIVVAPGYTDQSVYAAGGNPYGTSHAANLGLPNDEELAAARYQGRRLTTVATALAADRNHEQRIAA